MQRKEEQLFTKYEKLQKRRDEEEYERQMKMEVDLLNYYNNKEREECKKKFEFMIIKPELPEKEMKISLPNNLIIL